MTKENIRDKRTYDILETLTQEFFDNICSQIGTIASKRIRKSDQNIIRGNLGPITYHEFEKYVESMGQYTFDD